MPTVDCVSRYTLICPRLLHRKFISPEDFSELLLHARLRPTAMYEDSLGRRLRSERERRLITLESIAATTKINIGLLRDLEGDDASRWPSGIFRRSFIRSYAHAIGLDGDEIVQEFLDWFPDAEQLRAIAVLVAKGEAPKARPNPSFG